MPEFTLPQLSKPDTLPVLKLPEAPAMPARPAKPKREYKISAISVMLAVGVVLIVLAGMLFVRSQWSDMADFGKLGILAAGSAVFFGAAALVLATPANFIDLYSYLLCAGAFIASLCRVNPVYLLAIGGLTGYFIY